MFANLKSLFCSPLSASISIFVKASPGKLQAISLNAPDCSSGCSFQCSFQWLQSCPLLVFTFSRDVLSKRLSPMWCTAVTSTSTKAPLPMQPACELLVAGADVFFFPATTVHCFQTSHQYRPNCVEMSLCWDQLQIFTKQIADFGKIKRNTDHQKSKNFFCLTQLNLSPQVAATLPLGFAKVASPIKLC